MSAIRLAELEAIRPYCSPGLKVLELGGGRGVQARAIASWGCDIQSIDIRGRGLREGLVFPVVDYDGVHIPFPDNSFDIVFSSNVLEHVTNLPDLLADVRRVLRPSGVGIHVMPTPAWRLWTSVAHYVSMLQFLFNRARGTETSRIGCFEGPLPGDVLADKGWSYAATRALLPRAHGEFPSALVELSRYSRVAWKRVFASSGFRADQVYATGIFYAGYGIFPHWDLNRRKSLARWLGSACNVFVTRPEAS
jgi:SAM-dependent methyltransferase